MVACRDLVLGGKSKELEPFGLQRKLRESLITACMVYTKTIIHLSISESGDIYLHFGEQLLIIVLLAYSYSWHARVTQLKQK